MQKNSVKLKSQPSVDHMILLRKWSFLGTFGTGRKHVAQFSYSVQAMAD